MKPPKRVKPPRTNVDAPTIVSPLDSQRTEPKTTVDSTPEHRITQNKAQSCGPGEKDGKTAQNNDKTQQNKQKTRQGAGQGGKGDITADAEAVDEDGAAARARAKAEASRVFRRLNKEGRWAEVEQTKNDMIDAAKKKGLPADAAKAWAYAELDRLYPPLETPGGDQPPQKPPAEGHFDTPPSANTGIQGLGDIPDSWGTLSLNAPLPTELAWVQAHRLAIVETRPSGATVVHLDRAREPAPSMAALSWLETSLRSYAKYVDVCSRALASADDEQDAVRRERMALDEIKELLTEMHRDGVDRAAAVGK